MFIVIDKHGGWEYANIVGDFEGNPKTFNTIEEAQEEADGCLDGIVIGDETVSINTQKLIERLQIAFKRGDLTLAGGIKGNSADNINDFNQLKKEVLEWK